MLEEDNRIDVIEYEDRANRALIRLGLGHWRICWLPESSSPIRGRVVPETQVIEIYDIDEEDAWGTFIHEVVEIKMRTALRPYRVLVNKLIEGYQEIIDGEKDQFIESLSEVFEVARGSPPSA